MRTKIELTDTIGTASDKLAEGSPVARVVLLILSDRSAKIDSSPGMGPWAPLMVLDSANCYGDAIGDLYLRCGEDADRTLAMLRAYQLGFAYDVGRHRLQDIRPEDMPALEARVKERLPQFGVVAETEAKP